MFIRIAGTFPSPCTVVAVIVILLRPIVKCRGERVTVNKSIERGVEEKYIPS